MKIKTRKEIQSSKITIEELNSVKVYVHKLNNEYEAQTLQQKIYNEKLAKKLNKYLNYYGRLHASFYNGNN